LQTWRSLFPLTTAHGSWLVLVIGASRRTAPLDSLHAIHLLDILLHRLTPIDFMIPALLCYGSSTTDPKRSGQIKASEKLIPKDRALLTLRQIVLTIMTP
jgi:hypothetical protein